MSAIGQNKSSHGVLAFDFWGCHSLAPCQHIRNCTPNKMGRGDELIVFQTIVASLFWNWATYEVTLWLCKKDSDSDKWGQCDCLKLKPMLNFSEWCHNTYTPAWYPPVYLLACHILYKLPVLLCMLWFLDLQGFFSKSFQKVIGQAILMKEY